MKCRPRGTRRGNDAAAIQLPKQAAATLKPGYGCSNITACREIPQGHFSSNF
jgi:hypothetical protein